MELGQLSTFVSITKVQLVRSRLVAESFEKPLECCRIAVHRSALIIGISWSMRVIPVLEAIRSAREDALGI